MIFFFFCRIFDPKYEPGFAASRSTPIENTGKLIFYTDDNPDDVIMFKEAVHETWPDCRVESAPDGESLLKMLDSLDRRKKLNDLSFIVLDVSMPKKDGIQVLFDLKIDEKYRPIPVIMWSGSGNEKDKLRAYAMGCNTFVVKPDNYEGLVRKVKGLFEYWMRLASLPDMKQGLNHFR